MALATLLTLNFQVVGGCPAEGAVLNVHELVDSLKVLRVFSLDNRSIDSTTNGASR